MIERSFWFMLPFLTVLCGLIWFSLIIWNISWASWLLVMLFFTSLLIEILFRGDLHPRSRLGRIVLLYSRSFLYISFLPTFFTISCFCLMICLLPLLPLESGKAGDNQLHTFLKKIAYSKAGKIWFSDPRAAIGEGRVVLSTNNSLEEEFFARRGN